jgi:hypothetical protein
VAAANSEPRSHAGAKREINEEHCPAEENRAQEPLGAQKRKSGRETWRHPRIVTKKRRRQSAAHAENKDHTHGNGKISFGRDPAQTKSGGKQTALRPKSLKKNGTVVCWESCCAETKSNESKGICCKDKWLITKGRNLTAANQNSARFAAEREKLSRQKLIRRPDRLA